MLQYMVPGSWCHLPGNTYQVTCCQLPVGNCTSCAFTTSILFSWSGAPGTVITGLNTSTFTSVAWSFPLPSNQSISFVVGNLPPGSSLTQTTGDINLRNFRLYRVSGLGMLASILQYSRQHSKLKHLSFLGKYAAGAPHHP